MHGFDYEDSPRALEDAVIELNLSLEELASGLKKKLRINRTIYGANQEQTRKDNSTVTVNIPPGCKSGTQFRFEKAGDVRNGISQDVVFVVKEKPHSFYTRKGSDLETVLTLRLDVALCGAKITLPSIITSEPSHVAQIREPISPSFVYTFYGAGMPNPKTGQRGNIIVKFNIQFPKSISHDQKEHLKPLLKQLVY